jgi:hypothetical protein
VGHTGLAALVALQATQGAARAKVIAHEIQSQTN